LGIIHNTRQFNVAIANQAVVAWVNEIFFYHCIFSM